MGGGRETAISLEAVRSALPQEVFDIPANFHISEDPGVRGAEI